MRMTQRMIVVLVITIAVLAACSSASSPNAAKSTDPERNRDGFTDITVSRLDSMLAEKDFVLVNVHVPYEGEIPQTDLFIPFDEIEAHLDQLPANDAPIVLYCRSGNMSTTAAKELVALGYTNVMELDGGFNAWEAAGHELIRQP